MSVTHQIERRDLLAAAAGAAFAPALALAESVGTPENKGAGTMSRDELAAFFTRYIAALNTHDMDRMTEFVHPELTQHGKTITRNDVIASLKGHVAAVPDFRWRVVDMAIEGDTVAARLFNIGTPAKTWLGLEPTGATVEYGEFAFHKVRDGKFYEQNYAIDVLEVQRQLARDRS
jgi:predicted ester cyclase